MNFDWTHYPSLKTLDKYVKNVSLEHSDFIREFTIGKSYEGRRITMLKISLDGSCSNPGIWLSGCIHGRDWISTAVVTYIADYLITNIHNLPSYITNKDWYFVPVLNPDGYMYTRKGDRMWRKNKRPIEDEDIGVDLNRNFSYGWDLCKEGCSLEPSQNTYRGPEPFSEPETQAVKNAILQNNTKFKVFMSFHSYGEVITFPWGFTGDPCPDYVELLEAGNKMAEGIFETSGHVYKVGSTKDLCYYASGTIIDWSYGVAKIPYSYSVELGNMEYRHQLPESLILSTSQEILQGIRKFLIYLDTPSERNEKSCNCIIR